MEILSALEKKTKRIAPRFLELSHRLAYLSPGGYSPQPRWLVLAVNNVCNLHCKMCDVGTGTEDTTFWANLIGDGSGNMSRDLFRKILDDSMAFAVRPGLSFAYTEPGIHPEICELLETGRALGFPTSLTTNGYTLPKLAARLVEVGLSQLFVSLDGPKAIHDRIRGSAHSYDRIVEGLAKLAHAKKLRGSETPIVNVSFVLTEESYTTLPELIRELAPLGVHTVFATFLNFVHPDSAATHNAQFASLYPATVTNLSQVKLEAFDLDRFAAAIAAAKVAAHEANIGVRFLPDLATKSDLERYFRRPGDPVAGDHCVDPWTSVLIQTNGDVIPAHGRCFNTIVGNIRDASLAEIFNNTAMRDFRNVLRAEGGLLPACTRCCGCFDKFASTDARAGQLAAHLFSAPVDLKVERLRVLR